MKDTKRTSRSSVYFISDVHLGIDTAKTSADREAILISWLHTVSTDATAIYIVGDLFDYWFEYKSVVPQGYFKLFSTLHRIIETGVSIYYLKGNHDMWHKSYMTENIGVTLIDGPIEVQIDGRTFCIAHGDGLGPGDWKYKMIKSILSNPFFQKLFSLIHPTIGLSMMKYMSKKSRQGHDEESSSIDTHIQYCLDTLAQRPDIAYFIMGHLHKPTLEILNDQAIYINLGDWTDQFSYAQWDGSDVKLLHWT